MPSGRARCRRIARGTAFRANLTASFPAGIIPAHYALPSLTRPCHPIHSDHMKTDLDTALDLLHTATAGTLATQSRQLPGYPFATALPFVPDERNRPVFLVSTLAEHTRNLLADPRASFLVAAADQANVLAGARMTLMGEVDRVEATSELVARCVRYQPEAEQYLALGDFGFFRMAVR